MMRGLKRLRVALVNVHVRIFLLCAWVIAAIGGFVVLPVMFLILWAASELLDVVIK